MSGSGRFRKQRTGNERNWSKHFSGEQQSHFSDHTSLTHSPLGTAPSRRVGVTLPVPFPASALKLLLLLPLLPLRWRWRKSSDEEFLERGVEMAAWRTLGLLAAGGADADGSRFCCCGGCCC